MDDILKRMYQDRAWYASQLDGLDEYNDAYKIEELWDRINSIDEEIQYYLEKGCPTPYSGY